MQLNLSEMCILVGQCGQEANSNKSENPMVVVYALMASTSKTDSSEYVAIITDNTLQTAPDTKKKVLHSYFTSSEEKMGNSEYTATKTENVMEITCGIVEKALHSYFIVPDEQVDSSEYISANTHNNIMSLEFNDLSEGLIKQVIENDTSVNAAVEDMRNYEDSQSKSEIYFGPYHGPKQDLNDTLPVV